MGKLPSIPDLELPTAPSGRSAAPMSGAQPIKAKPSFDDDAFDGGIEHGMTAGPASAAPSQHRGKALSVDFGANTDDDFGDALERGGGSSPMSSSMAPSVSRGPVSRGPASLDVSYNRLDPRRGPRTYEPSVGEKIGAYAVPVIGFAAAFAPLVKYVHHAGARSIITLLPHAFDATSTVLSGIVSGVMLVASMAVGYAGLPRHRRSFAMIAAAVFLFLTCLAMVTVTLVSTDETPQPPDGARVVPYLVPLAVMLLGAGIAGRGRPAFLRGGARRALAFALGLIGGLVAYAGLALSTL